NNTEEVTEPEGIDCCVETGTNDCCNNNCDDANKNDREMESNRYITFANMLRSDNDEIKNKLNLILYVLKMEERESDGMEFVLENGPWMVNNKPLMVQKWDLDIVIDRSEPKTLPCWIKLHDVPLEAWTSNGLLVVFMHTENTCGLKSRNECIANKGVWNKKNDEKDNGFKKVRYRNKITKPTTKIGNGLGQGKPQGTKFVMNQRHPTIKDFKNWTNEMFKYFKEQWETKWINECPDEEDVFDNKTGISKSMTGNELDGHSYDLLNKGSNNESLQ
nr:zinc knuckle CX2CX4HX4C [Tanacetum cinerariifolium]